MNSQTSNNSESGARNQRSHFFDEEKGLKFNCFSSALKIETKRLKINIHVIEIILVNDPPWGLYFIGRCNH